MVERKAIRKFDTSSPNRQQAIMFFNTKNYKANLMRSAAKVSKTKKPHSYEDEIAKAEYNISLICNKRNLLHNNELNYIFDFLLEMCKYA